MHVICLNGSINSGKSTVGRALAAALPGAAFVEGDDHGAPDDTPFSAMLEIAIARLERAIAANEHPVLVLAYPLRDEDFVRLSAAARGRGARLSVVTLAPSLDLALSVRGDRTLSEDERARVREMYDEGYQDRAFSDLLLRDPVGVEETVERIVRGLGLVT